MQVKGAIARVYTKVLPRSGHKKYSICVPVEGKDTWFSTNDTKCPFPEGTVVTFDAVPDGPGGKYWAVAAADIKKVEDVSTVEKKGNWGYNSPERQQSIVAQSSINMALEFVGLALSNGALILGTDKAKASAKYDVLEEAVLKKAQEFFTISMNPDKFFSDEVGDSAADEEELDEDEFNPVPE